MKFGFRRFASAVAPLALLIASACANSGSPYVATTSRVEFYLAETTARDAFTAYCATATAEPCDEYDNYNMSVVFDDDLFSLTFVRREDAPSSERRTAQSIICAYTPRGRECASGSHTY